MRERKRRKEVGIECRERRGKFEECGREGD